MRIELSCYGTSIFRLVVDDSLGIIGTPSLTPVAPTAVAASW